MPPVSPLPNDFWEREREILVALLRPRIAAMVYNGMAGAATMAGLAFDGALYNQLAVQFAEQSLDALLESFVSREGSFVTGTGQILADWIAREGATIGDLTAKLTQLYSPQRANVIAVTEATRAFASGQAVAYRTEGIVRWQWTTNRDELVCPVCGGLNNKIVRIGMPFVTDPKLGDIIQPPAHPNCRCWVRPVR